MVGIFVLPALEEWSIMRRQQQAFHGSQHGGTHQRFRGSGRGQYYKEKYGKKRSYNDFSSQSPSFVLLMINACTHAPHTHPLSFTPSFTHSHANLHPTLKQKCSLSPHLSPHLCELLPYILRLQRNKLEGLRILGLTKICILVCELFTERVTEHTSH